MINYRIYETGEFLSILARLDAKSKRFVETKLATYLYPQLRERPHHGTNIRKLQGYRPATWRYRLGRFRLFYTIDENEHIVTILTFDDRKDAYR